MGGNWEIEDGSDDDLNIIKSVKRDLDQVDDYIENIIQEENSSQSDLQDTQDSVNACEFTGAQRIEWSDDEENGAAVYQKFKGRKSAQRRRALASTRRAKAHAAEVPDNNKHAQDKDSRLIKKVKHWGDVEADETLTEHCLPEFLKARKQKFDSNREKLKVAGLRLPPSFEHIDFSDDENIEHLKERPSFSNAKPQAKYRDIELPYSRGLIPAPIAQWLRDYQVQGVAFLHELFVYQKGGILGDDMGLGKTIQVIAFLTAAFGKTGDERDAKRMRKSRRAQGRPWYPRALVVCPGSLIENWKAEFNRWGWWHIDTYHGDSKETALKAATTGRLEVMITTYATYRMNKDAINMVEWDCVVADECHQIKELSSEVTKAMNQVNALCRIGLTGTAIQNKYEELWAILNWTNPGRFGPLSTWKSTVSQPLKVGQSHDATVYQLSRARKTAKKLVENLLPEFFLRRMKTLIAHQLPKKSDKVVFCPLSDTQRDSYERYLECEVIQHVKNTSDICYCNSGKKRGWCCETKLSNGDKWQSHVFPAISNLQKLSNHLAMLIPQSTDLPDKQERDLETLQHILPDQWNELYKNRDSILNFSNPEFCGKWKILKKLLRFWHGNGDKVLVFSHSVRLLKMLHMLFNHTSYNVSFLDGSMSYEERQITVDDFNSDPAQFVFLISTKAGGVGLNITSANKVVIVDPNWNPSYDLQAQDRAYRIGQVRDVEVFRLVSAGTIEEIVYARQIYKQQQANIGYNASTERRYFKGVQEKKDQKGEIFGLRNLFSFQDDNIILRDIVNKTNVAESKVGVDVVGFDIEGAANDEDDPLRGDAEDSAMSQLAALVQEEEVKPMARPNKIDAIQAILASAGVEYTHENSEVVGSSKVEAQLSRRAEEAGDDADVGEVGAFASAVPGSKLSNYKYHPPMDVMKRQFCSMAEHFGFNSAVEFALVVESWTQAQRRSCLEKFYRQRRQLLCAPDEADAALAEAREATADQSTESDSGD
ncbi:MAG: hypothetical protein M1829_001072 [Trizodia sp. TS-e1964]|nr:MAG: hypothetical protein M1829_001072 [Trizodia sp. TS-e1964]